MSDKPQAPQAQPTAPAKQGEAKTIATGLKTLYRSVVEEPIPDDLMDLLNSLDDG